MERHRLRSPVCLYYRDFLIMPEGSLIPLGDSIGARAGEMCSIHEGRNGVFAKGLVDVLSCNIALELPRYKDEVDMKPAQWWIAFSLDPSAHPPLPQGALSAGWADVSPMFKPTAKGADTLCVFTTDYAATAYMQALSAQGGSHPIITEGLNSRQDLEQIAKRFAVRYVTVNPPPAGEAVEVIPLSEFLDRLP